MSTYKPKGPLPENINRSQEHPLFTFASLVVQVTLLLAACYIVLYVAGLFLAKNISMENEHKYLNQYFSSEGSTVFGPYSDLANELWSKSAGESIIKFNPGIMSGEPNAFILPGGKILLTKGFLEQTESENELSFVLCHELGHFYHRHTVNGLANQLVAGLFQFIIGGNYSSVDITGLTQLFIYSKFSRDQESEADQFALECLNNKYKHINGYSHFFEKIKKLEMGLRDKYFSSHPATEDRIKNLSKIIDKYNFSREGELVPFSYAE